eukprot:4807519-Alexandrium_andersonii.AAC.1
MSTSSLSLLLLLLLLALLFFARKLSLSWPPRTLPRVFILGQPRACCFQQPLRSSACFCQHRVRGINCRAVPD